ncbi:hypothetical protein D3C81_1329240 [compost metagenome]
MRGDRQRGAAEPDGFGGDQDALGVQAMQDVFEALALFADPVFFRDVQVVDEQHVGIDGGAAHLVDLADLDLAAVDPGVEQRQPFGRLLHLLQRRGARQQQHAVGHLRGRDPDLAPAHRIAARHLAREGLEPGGVQARIGLGHAEAGLLLAGDQWRQVTALLFVGTKHHHRIQAEHVHVHCRGAGHARAGLRNGLRHQRGLQNAKAGAAKCFRHRHAQPPACAQRLVERMRIGAGLVEPVPVLHVELRADRLDCLHDGFLLFGKLKVHA